MGAWERRRDVCGGRDGGKVNTEGRRREEGGKDGRTECDWMVGGGS